VADRRGLRGVGVALTVAVTIASLAWVLTGIEWSRAAQALGSFRAGVLLPIAVLLTLQFGLRALRFRSLLRQAVPRGVLLSAVGVGFLAVNVVPMRLGEFVRPYLLDRYASVPFGTGLAATVLERVLDVLALLALLLLATHMAELPPGALEVGGVDVITTAQRSLGVLLVVVSVGVVASLVIGERAVNAVRDGVAAFSPSVAQRVERLGLTFVSGFRTVVSARRQGLVAVACTVGIWGITAVCLWWMMVGFAELAPTVDRVLLNFAGTATAVATIPTPGFFGAYELGSTAALALTGVDRSVAGTFGVAMHLVLFTHVVVTGVLCLIAQGWSLVSAVRGSRSADG